jgi:transposase
MPSMPTPWPSLHRPCGLCRALYWTHRPKSCAPSWRRRRQFMAMRTAEPNRLEHAPRRLRADIEAHIAWLEQRVAALDDDLDITLRASPVWRERETLYRSVPGMGPVCARTLVLDLPELGT